MNQQKLYNDIRNNIEIADFKFPHIQKSNDYFPDFLATRIDEFIDFYKTKFHNLIDEQTNKDKKGNLLRKINALASALKETIDLYYAGEIFNASEKFNKSLDIILFDNIKSITTISEKKIFYRSRKNEFTNFSKEDLFHIRFENRHLVSTNRYSVPGFPALYLSDSTYTCWEESNRHRLRELWFAKIETQTVLKVLQIERVEDVIATSDKNDEIEAKLIPLLRHLLLYPLTIACTIKVKNTNGNFKPEYIIPQLLMQYIAKSDKIDGIKFPSTKINYSKLEDLEASNYVFPVKTINKNGFCNQLIEKFYCSIPTSLELEEIIFNPTKHVAIHGFQPKQKGFIELVESKKSLYELTSFGKLEKSLANLSTSKIIY